MSVKVSGWVWDMNLPSSQKLVALALADHAHDDGTEARPGVTGLSKKCSMNERTAQRSIRDLLAKGVIVVQRPSTNTLPTVYRFPAPGGDNLSPQVPHRGDNTGELGVTDTTVGGDTSVTLTINEPSKEPSLLPDDFAAWFEKLWKLYPRRVDKVKAKRVLQSALKAKKLTRSEAWQAVANYEVVTFGRESSRVLYPSTFFGPDEKWHDYLDGSPELNIPQQKSTVAVDEMVQIVWTDFQHAFNGAEPATDTIKELLELQTLRTYGRMQERELREIIRQKVIGGQR